MASRQHVMFTAIPRSVARNPERIPVSVLISPRLSGPERLSEYPDFLHWTSLVKTRGLKVTFECDGQTSRVHLPLGALQPRLWDAVFNPQTSVRSFVFDDHSERFVASYPARSALALVKATYQAAGLEFALPTTDGDPRERQERRRGAFSALVGGYRMGFSAAKGDEWRDQQRRNQIGLGATVGKRLAARGAAVASTLEPDGQLKTGALRVGSPQFARAQEDLVQQFAVFSHVPPGAPVTRESLDEKTVLDFHQALSALNGYPALQRRLGLVFDLELPLDFVVPTPSNTPGELKIVAVEGPFESDVETTIPITSTAYVHVVLGAERVFFVAPRQHAEGDQPLGMLGLLNLDPTLYCVGQVDIDGALHKITMHADTLTLSRGPSAPQHSEIFDPTTTLASLRSGGFSLFADARAQLLHAGFVRAKGLNQDLQSGAAPRQPFCAEDLLRGFRLDIWDSHTQSWHSLHRKNTHYELGIPKIDVRIADEEGFVQLAATQAAPDEHGRRARDDLYLHEAVARWSGWSLSADMIGKHLTRFADPEKAVPDPAHPDPENQPVTPFKVSVKSEVVAGSLPLLRFGRGYRLRARVVDLAGNSMALDGEETRSLTRIFSLPRGDAVTPYLRFEPIVAPCLVLRAAEGVTGPGSSVNRLVIRCFNSDPSLDGAPAALAASDRHVAPPRASVELAERHGLFDDALGKLQSSAAMWQLIKQRDEGKFAEVTLPSVTIAGDPQSVPLEPAASLALPYLPDPLARGAALRDLPGTSPGTVTQIPFGGEGDWQNARPFRLALADGDAPPDWNEAAALLTVSLPKASVRIVPLTSYCSPEDLKLLGAWQWLREYVEFVAKAEVEAEFARSEASKDRIANILRLAREGGHWMLTPPELLTLVHAVQQPLGRPRFVPLDAQLDEASSSLRTAPEGEPTEETELAVASAWRVLGSTDAFLVGALVVHAESTAKLDLIATWTDPTDTAGSGPGEQTFSAHVDEIPLHDLGEKTLTSGDGKRTLGYYDREHDLACFAPAGARLGKLASGDRIDVDAAPCHRIGDARHHVVEYTAVATSRFREYFPQDAGGSPRDFTRKSDPVTVHVPASARPVAPQVLYVLPSFGWQRETDTHQKRSVRLGGGLRIYLDRPWFSSGAGELLGVVLFSSGALDREDWKPYVSQWGQDPIWASAPLDSLPNASHFTDAVAVEEALPLDVRLPKSALPRLVNVAGHRVAFDQARKLWYCDLTVSTRTPTYAPFVRLALARYQPHALVEAKLSRVVLADFVQLAPERAATVSSDPHQSGRLRVAVSGPGPRGPTPPTRELPTSRRPSVVGVLVEERDTSLDSDLAWHPSNAFVVSEDLPDGSSTPPADFVLWSGTVSYVGSPGGLEPGRFRLRITEHELLQGDGPPEASLRRRLIYAEHVHLDAALLDPPALAASGTHVS
jgi:hypothetical protein